jgi:membrane-associated phospholipid phosphatase
MTASTAAKIGRDPAGAAKRRWIVILAMIGLFIVALAVDIPISTWCHDRQWGSRITSMPRLRFVLRFPGLIWFPLIACGLLLLKDWLNGYRTWWRDAAIVALAALFSGVNALLKWAIGRIRPFKGVGAFQLHPFKGGFHGSMLAEQNLTFPSGDASLAFAMSASLSMVAPRPAPLWWVLGIMVALERIAEGAHYPSDTVAGAGLGIVAALAARRVIAVVWGAGEPSHHG